MTCRPIALGALLLVGCPGSIDDEAPFIMHEGSTCPDDYDVERDLFAGTCGQLACHSGGSVLSAAGLDLTGPDIGTQIMAHRSVDCGGRALVDPGHLEGSYMLEKIDDERPECGDRMPAGLEPLSGIERACLIEYLRALAGSIDAGVPADAGVTQAADDGGAPARDAISIEAETMMLSGYVVDAVYPDAIRLPDAVPEGTATAEITASGSYTLRVYAMGEPDGQPVLVIRIGGRVIATETFALGTADIEPLMLGPYEVDVLAGETLELTGTANAGAWARLDRAELTP